MAMDDGGYERLIQMQLSISFVQAAILELVDCFSAIE